MLSANWREKQRNLWTMTHTCTCTACAHIKISQFFTHCLQVSWFLKNCHSSHETWFLILKSLKTQERSFESRLSTSFEAISLRCCRRQRIPQTLTLLDHKEVDTIFLEFLLEWIDKRTLSRDKQLSDHLSRKEYYHWIGYMWQQINLSIKVKTTALYNFPGGCSLLTLYTQT